MCADMKMLTISFRSSACATYHMRRQLAGRSSEVRRPPMKVPYRRRSSASGAGTTRRRRCTTDGRDISRPPSEPDSARSSIDTFPASRRCRPIPCAEHVERHLPPAHNLRTSEIYIYERVNDGPTDRQGLAWACRQSRLPRLTGPTEGRERGREWQH